MGPRRTNLALLVVLVAALATGGLAFAAGTGWGRPVVVAHAAAGLAVLVLAPWKSVVVRRGLARRAGAGPWVSVAFGSWCWPRWPPGSPTPPVPWPVSGR
jgi:hypothetical protein